jgi:hypothetical protein
MLLAMLGIVAAMLIAAVVWVSVVDLEPPTQTIEQAVPNDKLAQG